MAESEYKRGTMDIRQHQETFEGFMGLTKWSIVLMALLLLGMGVFLTG